MIIDSGVIVILGVGILIGCYYYFLNKDGIQQKNQEGMRD
jgi:hypothetical protein